MNRYRKKKTFYIKDNKLLAQVSLILNKDKHHNEGWSFNSSQKDGNLMEIIHDN